ncbi:hypothetical protein Tco_0949499 [Tanacetum coccineum]
MEPGAFTLFPKILPIGPLLATNRETKQAGHFWNEDSTCLIWLDQQPVSSVIYVAFRSFAIFNQPQLEELALGLERTNKPFLWVVRPGTSGSTEYVYPSGYMERIGSTRSIEPSLGGLLHYYICDIWNTGLELNRDDTGIVTRKQIKSKVEQLLSNNFIRQNAVNLQEKTMASVREGNSSNKNLINFIDWVKKGKVDAPANEISQSSS